MQRATVSRKLAKANGRVQPHPPPLTGGVFAHPVCTRATSCTLHTFCTLAHRPKPLRFRVFFITILNRSNRYKMLDNFSSGAIAGEWVFDCGGVIFDPADKFAQAHGFG